MSQTLTRTSPGKINLLLNVLGRRDDGFHELETLLLPIAVRDELSVSRQGQGVRLTCSYSELPTDSRNLVHRAATVFLDRAGVSEGVSIHLEKRIPLESGLGGGSSNAATTLLLLNEIFGGVLDDATLTEMATGLGSDVPFFLQSGPALATGRGERIRVVEPFECLGGTFLFLVHPGFGVSTPWAYKQLAAFPDALNGKPGRAEQLAATLRAGGLDQAGARLYNALEGPVHTKYPLLLLFREFLLQFDPLGVLMSGSGSTTFSLWSTEAAAREAEGSFRQEFGDNCWTATVAL
jgi:4-diphosphocytidyl-2-C-methyl-D-erythritol kinase